MAVSFSPSIHTPPLPFRPRCFFPAKQGALFPILPFRNLRISGFVLVHASRNAVPGTEQEVLWAVADSDENSLPCVRTYENDLARLTLVGAVDFQQALTATVVDGGLAANEHIQSGRATMVVETVFPGYSDQHSTVSTRLFLPERKVKEKAGKLRLGKDIFSGATFENILVMTFRQVVLQQLWSFELVLFRPGTERNMEDLENPREVEHGTDGFSSLMLFVSAEILQVRLADVIDMYHEDLCTLPNKELSCGVVGNFTNLPNKKRSSVLLKILLFTAASGIFIITISALGQSEIKQSR